MYFSDILCFDSCVLTHKFNIESRIFWLSKRVIFIPKPKKNNWFINSSLKFNLFQKWGSVPPTMAQELWKWFSMKELCKIYQMVPNLGHSDVRWDFMDKKSSFLQHFVRDTFSILEPFTWISRWRNDFRALECV